MEARTFTLRKERDVPEHMMLEGFRWSIGNLLYVSGKLVTCCDQKARLLVFLDRSLTPVTNCVCESLLGHLTISEGLVSRLLIRTITEGSTAVMQLGQKPLSLVKSHIVFIQSLRPNPLLLWQNLECLKVSIPLDF